MNHTDNDKCLTCGSSGFEKHGDRCAFCLGHEAGQSDDFELPAKACDIGRPEGCDSCQ